MENTNCFLIKEGDFEPWAYEKVKAFEDIPNLDYWRRTENVSEKYIPLTSIVGTNHHEYGGRPDSKYTWIDVLQNMKNKRYEDREKLTLAICDAEPSPTVGKFGDEYYIFGGNNRLCKARFLELSQFCCHVIEYSFDEHEFQLSQTLEECGFSFHYNKFEKTFERIEYRDKLIHMQDENSIEKFAEVVSGMEFSAFEKIRYGIWRYEPDNKPFIFDGSKKSIKSLKAILYYLDRLVM